MTITEQLQSSDGISKEALLRALKQLPAGTRVRVKRNMIFIRRPGGNLEILPTPAAGPELTDFITSDGYRLKHVIHGALEAGVWTDGDLIFPSDEHGHPINAHGEKLDGHYE